MTTEAELFFGERHIELRQYSGKHFTMRGFETENGQMWLMLSDVLKTLNVNEADLKPLTDEQPENVNTLSNGERIISEGGFNWLALFVSETEQAREYQEWVFGAVLPDIATKGYYSLNGK